jgi:hypothetical protein
MLVMEECEVLDRVRRLPLARALVVEAMVDELHAEDDGSGPEPRRGLRSMAGMWAGMGIEITDEDIDEARREMWGNFPRDDIV